MQAQRSVAEQGSAIAAGFEPDALRLWSFGRTSSWAIGLLTMALQQQTPATGQPPAWPHAPVTWKRVRAQSFIPRCAAELATIDVLVAPLVWRRDMVPPEPDCLQEVGCHVAQNIAAHRGHVQV